MTVKGAEISTPSSVTLAILTRVTGIRRFTSEGRGSDENQSKKRAEGRSGRRREQSKGRRERGGRERRQERVEQEMWQTAASEQDTWMRSLHVLTRKL